MSDRETLSDIVAGLASPWPGGSAQRKAWEEDLLRRIREAALYEPIENYSAIGVQSKETLSEALNRISRFIEGKLSGVEGAPPSVRVVDLKRDRAEPGPDERMTYLDPPERGG